MMIPWLNMARTAPVTPVSLSDAVPSTMKPIWASEE